MLFCLPLMAFSACKPPAKPSYLPMNFLVDGSYYEKGSTFKFIFDNRVMVTVRWNGKKYVVEK